MSRIQRQMTQELGRDPTPEELAVAMETTPERIVRILKIAQEPVSLETPVGRRGRRIPRRVHRGRRAARPHNAVALKLRNEEVRAVLDQLSHRERTVLELRYGLAGDDPLTLEDVGRHFGVTRERIRQIESRTLMKLKAFRDSGRLKDVSD